MTETIDIGGMAVDVIQKDIKNVHLSVYPPLGKVRISAPLHMSLDTIRVFAVSKLGWIRQEQKKLRDQERETPREYLDRESHYLWGKRYLLKVVEQKGASASAVDLNHNRLVLHVGRGIDVTKKEAVVARWYRDQIKAAVPTLIDKWSPVLGVTVTNFFVRQMKTKWGSCNPAAGNIRFNSELAKKPRGSLEYIVVHEMVHLLEPTHNQHFIALMDRFMPLWRGHRDELNRLPVRHEHWVY